jgi:hypothetical protein
MPTACQCALRPTNASAGYASRRPSHTISKPFRSFPLGFESIPPKCLVDEFTSSVECFSRALHGSEDAINDRFQPFVTVRDGSVNRVSHCVSRLELHQLLLLPEGERPHPIVFSEVFPAFNMRWTRAHLRPVPVSRFKNIGDGIIKRQMVAINEDILSPRDPPDKLQCGKDAKRVLT